MKIHLICHSIFMTSNLHEFSRVKFHSFLGKKLYQYLRAIFTRQHRQKSKIRFSPTLLYKVLYCLSISHRFFSNSSIEDNFWNLTFLNTCTIITDRVNELEGNFVSIWTINCHPTLAHLTNQTAWALYLA